MCPEYTLPRRVAWARSLVLQAISSIDRGTMGLSRILLDDWVKSIDSSAMINKFILINLIGVSFTKLIDVEYKLTQDQSGQHVDFFLVCYCVFAISINAFFTGAGFTII